MSNTIDAIAEGITVGQIGKVSELLSAGLRKNASTLPSNSVQDVLKDEGAELVKEFIASFRTRVERRASMIVRHATVNRSLPLQKVLDATGRKQYVSNDVLATIPANGTGTEDVDVYFFKVGRYLNAEELDKEYVSRGLNPDPYAQAKVNEDDPAFADEHPNGTQWNREGKVSSYLAFDWWGGERVVFCYRDDDGWSDDWWFSGVRKVSE